MAPHRTHGAPTTPGTSIPNIRSTDPAGLPKEKRQPATDERAEAPPNPKTSGAPKPAPDTSRSPAANRDLEGPRKASTTPRPTDKPISE